MAQLRDEFGARAAAHRERPADRRHPVAQPAQPAAGGGGTPGTVVCDPNDDPPVPLADLDPHAGDQRVTAIMEKWSAPLSENRPR